MSERRRLAGFHLVHLLLAVTVAELAVNRLLVPTLRPIEPEVPPIWHGALAYVGVFCEYFACALAIGLVGRELLRLVARWRHTRETSGRPLRLIGGAVIAFVAIGTGFLAMGAVSVVEPLGNTGTFAFETLFTLALVGLVLSQAAAGGDLGVKIGVALFAMPLIVHYYGPLSVQVLAGEEILWTDLPERVQRYGQWAMVLAAASSPYCLGPRPLLRWLGDVPAAVIAALVGVVGLYIMREHYEVGMLMASRGLGVELGPGVPTEQLALYLIALATVTWTFVACLTSASESRRRIGVGMALVVVGGYSFFWPLQYLVSFAGLFTISREATTVVDEERRAAAAPFSPPPVSDSAWQAYVMAVVAGLRAQAGARMSTLTSRTQRDVASTVLVGQRAGLPVRVRIERLHDAPVTLDVVIGEEVDDDVAPAWSLHAKAERLLGAGAHPEPPATPAPVRKAADVSFDRRFRMRDAADHGGALFDEHLRARAAGMLDGWAAYWPRRGLRYRVHPGHGAPLDHPIPITDLAFRGSASPEAVERLVALVDLLVTIAGRVLQAPPEAEDEGAAAERGFIDEPDTP